MPENETIPGLRELWRLTTGDPRVLVAVLDGQADLEHPYLKAANLRHGPGYWLGDGEFTDRAVDHATHVCSVLFSPHDTEVKGVAPGCRGLNIPVQKRGMTDTYQLVRAIDAARDAGANIIHVAMVQPTRSGEPDSFLERAVRTCLDEGILVVSPAGNDRGEFRTMPSAIPGVLAVGAMRDDGRPFKFSNFGGILRQQGVLAPGENIFAADPLGGASRHKGTSCSAPVVSGVAALLMSLQLREGRSPSAEEVRWAILDSAVPCDPDEVEEPERCLRGRLNIAGAAEKILGRPLGVGASAAPVERAVPPRPEKKRQVFVLGAIGYDFGTESRRDTFKQLMPPADAGGGVLVPANPYDPRQMSDYLVTNPSEARSLLWTVHQEGTPVYALKPVGAFGPQVYETLRLLLAGQVEASGGEAYVERVSVPGGRTDRVVRLLSGQEVPVLKLRATRGLYGWDVDLLIDDALAGAAPDLPPEDAPGVRRGLRAFLDRVYHDHRNDGSTSRDRALNFAATNAFQVARAFVQAVAERRRLKGIEVVKSPVCRPHSDCWDVRLKFFDPENDRRATRVYRLTVDVSDLLPVTLGEVSTWLSRE
jgi:hypothetical protein